EVDRAFTGDTFYGPVGWADDDPSSRNHDAIMPTDGIEIEKSVVVDVRDDKSQLIEMTGKHQDRVTARIERGHPVTERILAVDVGDVADMAIEHRLGLELVAGRRARGEELGQKRRRLVDGFGHAKSDVSWLGARYRRFQARLARDCRPGRPRYSPAGAIAL